jgi:hypothetical protein
VNRRAISILVVLALAVFGGQAWLVRDAAVDLALTGTERAVADAFAQRSQGLMLEFEATVVRLLRDDADGSRHLRFLVRTQDDIVVLVAHNIDLAPRIKDLDRGDRLRLRGQYEWNEKGGVLHWTHRAPRGDHAEGWIEHEGRRYE